MILSDRYFMFNKYIFVHKSVVQNRNHFYFKKAINEATLNVKSKSEKGTYLKRQDVSLSAANISQNRWTD